VLLDLSNLLVDTGQTRPAVACLKRLVHLEPGNVDAWAEPGRRPVHGRPLQEGITSCHEAIARDADNVMALYNLALAYEHLGRYDDALVWCAKSGEGAQGPFASRAGTARAGAETGRNG